jgi:hypothetical protein
LAPRNSGTVNQSLVEQFTGVGVGFGAAQTSSNAGASKANNLVGDAATGGNESGLSCVTSGSTSNFCVAAGNYVPTSADQTLIMQWNGWSGPTYTNPTTYNSSASFNNDLMGISCPTTLWCMAVGSYSSGGITDQALAEQWILTPTSTLAHGLATCW